MTPYISVTSCNALQTQTFEVKRSLVAYYTIGNFTLRVWAPPAVELKSVTFMHAYKHLESVLVTGKLCAEVSKGPNQVTKTMRWFNLDGDF